MLQEKDGKRTFSSICSAFIYDMRKDGAYCCFEYPYDDFEVLKNEQLKETLFKVFHAVWVGHGAKLYCGLDSVIDLTEGRQDRDEQSHVFALARFLFEQLPTNLAIVVTMKGDAEAECWGEPGVFFLEEENWDWQLLATLLPVLKDIPMPFARRVRLASMEAELAAKFPAQDQVSSMV